MPSNINVKLTETDLFIYLNEIRPYLPNRIFDSHSHLCINDLHPNLESLIPLTKDPSLSNIDFDMLEHWWWMLFPDSQVSGLVIGFPTRGCNINGINSHLAQHITYPNRFSILCGPDMDIRTLETQILEFGPAGLKPYMCFSRKTDPNSSSICDMIPEVQIALADKYHMAVTLHVAKPRGMADPNNLADIARLVKDYPKCNFILAHCGRCFISPNMEVAMKHLPVAQNLWVDTSAVCDTGVFLSLLDSYDKTRIVFGTDLVTAAGFRGAYIRMGMSWDLVTAECMSRPGGQNIHATFAAYENLCALLRAARFCKMNQTQLADIFYNNAANLFQLEAESP